MNGWHLVEWSSQFLCSVSAAWSKFRDFKLWTYFQDFWFLSEDFHRCLNPSIELPGPRYSPGYRRKVTGDDRLALFVLVDLADGLQVPSVGTEDAKILGVDVKLGSTYMFKLAQEVHGLYSLQINTRQIVNASRQCGIKFCRLKHQ